MNFLIAFFGSVVYNIILFVFAKDNCDKEGKPFPYLVYARMNWDNWLLTFCVAPIVVWYLADILTLINHFFGLSMPVLEVYYLGAGVLVEVMYFGLTKLAGWKKTWVAPVHKD